MKKILLIDDDSLTTLFFESIFNKHVQNELICENDGGIIFNINWDDIGCILLDLRLPVMSGFEILDQMKKDGIEVPVIIESATPKYYLNNEQLDKVKGCGYIEKPFNYQDVLDVLESYIVLK